MATKIYLSYRRDDSNPVAARLRDQLAAEFGSRNVFMDVESIAPGVDFQQFITDRIADAGAVLVLIGPRWLGSMTQDGHRRLDDPYDFVRREIASALSRDAPVIPVLVDGAVMPRMTDLPDDLQPLARRNAVTLSHERFSGDVRRLVQALRRTAQPARQACDTAPPII
jgi:hypothetical protein